MSSPADALGFLSDDELAVTHDNALADLTLAEKYSHNAALVPAIRLFLDRVHAEESRRMTERQRSHL